MKKKIFLIIISLIMIVSLCSCGNERIIYEPLSFEIKDTNNVSFSVNDAFGGSKSTFFTSIAQAEDGGYVVVGNTLARDGDCKKIDSEYKDSVGVAVKYDKEHKIKWKRFFGAESDVKFNDIVLTNDGGFLIVGYTDSSDLTGGNYGLEDGIIIKIDSKGKTKFIKHFGGNDKDIFNSVDVCPDGGFVVCGSTNSNDKDLEKQGNPENDALLVKFNEQGEKQWLKVFGGTKNDSFAKVSADKNGNIFALCNAFSNDGEMSEIAQGSIDCLVMKYDSNGKLFWQKSYSGQSTDVGNALVATNDGGCIIGGYYVKNYFINGIFEGQYYYDKKDAFVLRTNEDGSIKWLNSFGGKEDDEVFSILPAKNGFIVTGTTESVEGTFASVSKKGETDAFISFYDESGNITMLGNFGGSKSDYIFSTTNFFDGVLFAGFSVSDDYDLKNINSQPIQRGISGVFKIN